MKLIRNLRTIFSLMAAPAAVPLAGAFVVLMTLALGSSQALGQTVATFSTAGNTTWTCPAGVTSVQVETWGGGGGSGGAGAHFASTGGGAGGSYVRVTSVAVTPGTTYQLTVGTGGTAGAGGAVTGTAGGTGGSSYFGNTAAGNPAGASVLAVGGAGSVGNNATGTSTTSRTVTAGATASNSGNLPSSGAAANTAGTSGATPVANKNNSGAGGAGAGPSGSAGGGPGGTALTSAANGNPGTAPGGGGGGADQSSSSGNGTGGTGGAGQIVLTYTPAIPTINTAGTPAAMTTSQGTASLPASFSVSGNSLTASITINAPTGFEISTVSGSGYSGSLTLTPSSGTVSATTIYVRLTATDAAGTYSGNVSLSSSGVTTVNVAVPSSTVASPFTPGNLAVLSPDNGTAAETTFSVLEISPTQINQNNPVQSIPINGAIGNPGTALRMGTSGTSGGLSSSSDGTLLTFAGYNTTNTTGASTVQRGVGTLNNQAAFALPATYQGNGAAGNQTRSATTVDNQNFYWADKGGIYINNGTTPSDGQNVLRIKSFGGTVYVINQQGFASVVSVVSPDGSTLYALPSFPTGTDANAKDFYLISSGNNGSTYDILYQIDSTTATIGTIYKYSLVAGEWVANGTYTTPFGGCGICAANTGGGAALYVVTGLGTAANNSIEKLTDTAGYNAGIAITDNGTLYTAPGATSFKGVAFVPVAYTVTYAGNGNTGGTAPVDGTSYGAGAAVTLAGPGNLSKTGYVFAGWNTSAIGNGINASAGINFNITANTTYFAQWVAVNSTITNQAEVGSTVTYTVDPTQSPFSSIAAPYGYQWYVGSTPLAGQTAATLTLPNVQFSDAGSYSVVVSNTASSDPGVSSVMAVLHVVDTHPPVLTLPANVMASTGSGGVQVTFSPTAVDLDLTSNPETVICSPPSGSYFSPGTTLVNCYAVDHSGNTASGSFLVTVTDTDPTTNIVVNGRIYVPYSPTLAVGTWVWIETDPNNGSPMRATQRLLGEDEVTEKGLFFAGAAFTQVTPTITGQTKTYDYSAQSSKNAFTVGQLANKFDPILVGPDGLAYITDGHHTMAAYLLPVSPVHQLIPGYNRIALGQISENLYGQGSINDAWWLARQTENNSYLYGTNGDQLVFPGEPNYANSQPILPTADASPMPTTPSELSGPTPGIIPMINDDGRSLGWGVRQGIVPSAFNSSGPVVGYANTAPDGTAINFVDFFWGDFFRNRVVWDNTLTPTGSGDANAINAPLSFFAASANGIALAKSELYRDQNGRSLFDYTNLNTYITITTNANTVAWAVTAIGNGLAAVGDTYNMYLRDDSTISGDIIPSALSTNILHIDTAAGMTVTQLVKNVKFLDINMGAQLTTIFPDAFVANSTLTFPAGTGEVWLNNTSYISSATLVSNGICSVNGILNSPTVTVTNGGTLKGDGIINGAVTVQSTATLSPGNSIGTLTVNGPLTLAGTTVMEINKTGATLTSDLVTGVTTLTFGGTLTVNDSGDPLLAGDSFTLFSAAHYAGAFTTINLPTLTGGLQWDLSKLAQNGTIKVLGANTAYYTRPANVTLKIYISDLLTNVTVADGYTASFVGVGTDGLNNLTTSGSTLVNYGSFIGYTNSAPPNINDSFKYTVSDGHGSTYAGTVMIIMNNNIIGQSNVVLNVSSANVTANFFGWPGFRYTVERSTNLMQGSGWVPISTNTAPADGLMQVIDTFQDLDITVPPVPANAYYRLRYNP